MKKASKGDYLDVHFVQALLIEMKMNLCRTQALIRQSIIRNICLFDKVVYSAQPVEGY